MAKTNLPFFTLLLLISFASVNAVLFTPALPNIMGFFKITESEAQRTMTAFLIGYTLGQLLYGPIANRFGRKKALFGGITLQIISSFLCILSGNLGEYTLLVLGRFFLALGSGVGLKMTFTLVNEYYEPKIASQKIAYLMLAFAITPGLGIALGGAINTYYGWQGCFYLSALYGLILVKLVASLPETKKHLDVNALKIKHLMHDYSQQFKNFQLIVGGVLMGGAGSFIYVFAAVAPFMAIDLLGMSSSGYGAANILPTFGLLLGSLFTAQFVKKYSLRAGIKLGLLITTLSTACMLIAIITKQSPLIELFLPMMLSYFGLALIFANASTMALSEVLDKAHGSAVMNFVNMGLITLVVWGLGLVPLTPFLLPITYIILCIMMGGLYLYGTRS